MFICQRCDRLSEPREKASILPLKVKLVEHPYRKNVQRQAGLCSRSNREETCHDDHGGKGYQWLSSILICTKCVAALGPVEPLPTCDAGGIISLDNYFLPAKTLADMAGLGEWGPGSRTIRFLSMLRPRSAPNVATTSFRRRRSAAIRTPFAVQSVRERAEPRSDGEGDEMVIKALLFFVGAFLSHMYWMRVRVKKLNERLHYHQQIWRGMFPYSSCLPPESRYIVEYYGWKLGALSKEPPHPHMDPEYYHTMSDWERARQSSDPKPGDPN